jgi:hypothetical protein
MPHTPTPWVGLAALLAMFLLPYLSECPFEGPRTIRHWPRRHVRGDRSAPGPTITPAHPHSARPLCPFPGSCTGPTPPAPVDRPMVRTLRSGVADPQHRLRADATRPVPCDDTIG